MFALRPLAASCVVGLLFAAAHSIARYTPHTSGTSRNVPAPDACALLTVDQVSAALEVKSLAGRHPVPSATSLCIWSDDAHTAISHRRLTLAITSSRAFDIGETSPVMSIEPVKGIGDDAYFAFLQGESPSLNVRKGTVTFSIRILNGLKFKPFTSDQDKSKETALAQAAVTAL